MWRKEERKAGCPEGCFEFVKRRKTAKERQRAKWEESHKCVVS